MDLPHLKHRTEETPLKAEPAAQLVLLDLQELDATLAQLAHRKSHLLEKATLDELTAKAAELDGQRVEHETRVSDLSHDQRRADADVEQVKARRERDNERLNSGAITNPKDLEGLQREIVALERRIATLEDEELEVMEALEEAQSALTAVLTELDSVSTSLVAAQEAYDNAVAVIDAQVSKTSGERDVLVPSIPGELLALYEKLRAQYSVGAGALRQRRCEACRLELNGADLRELADKEPDDVLRCPECSRILVRTHESGL